jgi:hypothetical protein
MPAPEISSIGNAPEGYTFVNKGAPGAVASQYGGYTFYLAPIKAAATAAAKPAAAPAPRPTAPPVTVTAPPTPQYGTSTAFPEQTALQQMRQIDPATEALRQQLAQSYATPLTQAGGPPSAGTLQSYLNLYRQVDPTTALAQQQLGQRLQSQAALGSQLDPQTAREVAQGVRMAQGARGNVYGTPQMVEEAMTRGQAGMALSRQRQQDLQSYLSSGMTPGATAFNLYQQNLGNLRQAQGAAQSYLGSGQTPYQAGAGYLGNVQQQAGAASQGGPQYQPSALSSPYSYFNPNYGQSMGSQANQWYNSLLSSYGMQQAGQGKNQAMGALAGAAGGALSGAIGGSAVPGVGTLVGAGIGAIGGGLSGYFG